MILKRMNESDRQARNMTSRLLFPPRLLRLPPLVASFRLTLSSQSLFLLVISFFTARDSDGLSCLFPGFFFSLFFFYFFYSGSYVMDSCDVSFEFTGRCNGKMGISL